MGSKNANEALKLAKKSKAILKDFDLTKAMSLKNNISTWKAMNGVKEDKKFFFKLINKKLRTNKQVAAKQVDQDKSKTKKNNNTENTISKKDKDRFAFIGMCSFTFQKALYMLRNNNSPKKENYKKHLNKVNMEYSFLSRKYNFSKTQNGKKIDGNDISPIQRKGQKLVDDYYYSAEDTFKKNKNILLIQIKKCNYEFPLVKKQSNYNQQQKRNLKVGYIYKYYTDNSCRSSGKEYCISRSEMKSYCNSITGISKIGYRGSLTFARDPYGKGNNQDFRRYAARNTGPEKFNTYLTPRPYPCWVSFYYSGTYKGTSFTNKVNQPVLTFLKTKNKILVHATKSF